MLGVIKSIEQVHGMGIEPVAGLNGSGGRLGVGGMITQVLGGYSSMDGYKVETDKHTFHVLIDNEQSCCESWGYSRAKTT